MDLSQTYLTLHRDTQEEYTRRYGGAPGPIIPVHTRNDVENIVLCGEEDFSGSPRWPRRHDFGKVVGFWHFNGVLADASREGPHPRLAGGRPPRIYVQGICQPGPTAVDLDGSHYLTLDDAGLNLGTEDFTIEMVLKPGALTNGARLISKTAPGGPGFEVCLGPGGAVQVVIADASGASTLTPSPGLALDTASHHYLALAADRDGQFTFSLDGSLGTCAAARPGSLDNGRLHRGTPVRVGGRFFQGAIDLIRVHRGRALGGAELRTTGGSSRVW